MSGSRQPADNSLQILERNKGAPSFTHPKAHGQKSRQQSVLPPQTANLAAAAVQSAQMQSGLDPLGPPPSFTARKSAASHLPSFELPPPPISLTPGKFPSIGDLTGFQPSASGGLTSVGNLLTPPNTLPSDSLSPPPSTTDPSNNQHIPQGSSASAFSRNNAYWPSTSPQSQPPQYQYQTGSNGQWSPSRGVFPGSSLNSMLRGNDPFQPTRNDVNNAAAAAAVNEMYQLPPFPSTIPMSASVSLPAMVAASQQPLNAGLLQQQMSAMNPHPTQSMSTSTQDPFYPRLPPTPTYYNLPQPSPNTQQQQAFSFPLATSPPLRTPSSATSQSIRMSPLNNPSMGEMPSLQSTSQQTSPQDFQRPFGQYPLPALTGPVMPNLSTSSSHMNMVGGMSSNMLPGFTSGHAASMASMYGGMPHSSQSQQPAMDKPFKCDQCMQSFNRNHDLKRHKRIHLAVKPYPCGHCDKSFSRKDALKVCVLSFSLFFRNERTVDLSVEAHLSKRVREGPTSVQ